MNIKSRKEPSASVFEVLDDRIDSSCAEEFKDKLCDAIDGGEYDIVLDLNRVEMIDSSGMGAIVATFKHLGARGSFTVAGARSAVARIFRLTRMEKVFPSYATVEEALASR